jgi:hypothetical protein
MVSNKHHMYGCCVVVVVVVVVGDGGDGVSVLAKIICLLIRYWNQIQTLDMV